MEITYSESPSFDSGWWISIDTRRKTILFRLLPHGTYFRSSSERVKYEKYYCTCELGPQDETILSQLLDNVVLKIDQEGRLILDGTLQALSLSSGNGRFIGVEWNSGTPKGTGIEPLVEKLRSMANSCRTSRETGV